MFIHQIDPIGEILSSLKRPLETQEQSLIKKSRTSSSEQTLYFDASSSCSLTDEIFLKSIANVSTLKELSWFSGFNEVTDKSIEVLKGKAKDLTRLELRSGGKMTAGSLSELISHATQLQSIDFGWCEQINDLFAEALVNCSRLEELKLQYCENVTDHTVELIAMHSQNLKFLDLEGCKKCTDTALFFLAQSNSGILNSLEKLYFNYCPSISNAGIQSIASTAKNLKDLNLKGCEQLTDTVIPIIAALGQLEILNISCSVKITDNAFTSLERKHFPSLKELNLSGTSITNLTIQKFLEIGLGSSLLSLSLNSCLEIDWKSLKLLRFFTHLSKLEIASNNLKKSKGVLEKLKRCTQLEILNINDLRCTEHTRFSAVDITSLVRTMPQLKTLYVAGLGRATDFKQIIAERANLQLISSF